MSVCLEAFDEQRATSRKSRSERQRATDCTDCGSSCLILLQPACRQAVSFQTEAGLPDVSLPGRLCPAAHSSLLRLLLRVQLSHQQRQRPFSRSSPTVTHILPAAFLGACFLFRSLPSPSYECTDCRSLSIARPCCPVSGRGNASVCLPLTFASELRED